MKIVLSNLVLSNPPVQSGPGKSVFVRLRHLAHSPITENQQNAPDHQVDPHKPIHLWLNGREFGRPARSRSEIEQLGDGRALIDGDTLWFSFPNTVEESNLAHPDAPLDLIIDIPSLTAPQTEEMSSATPTPIYIVGPQRCGSSALLWALDRGTRFVSPKPAATSDIVLEGYLLRQFLTSALSSITCSPFGEVAQPTPPVFPTGMLEQSGDMEFCLRQIARAIDITYRRVCGGADAWVDKAPGWDVLATVPLFHALFPHGRSIMMTREPVSCVLSIIRLNGLDLYELPDPDDSKFIAEQCANWMVNHFLWRTACENCIPKNRTLVVSMNELRDEPERAASPLQDLLQLNPQERDGLIHHLHGGPVPVHQATRPTIDPRLKFVIEELTSAEARCWSYKRTQATTATLPHGYLNRVRNRFQQDVVTMLTRQGLASTIAGKIATWAIENQPPGGMPAHTLKSFDRPFHFGPGSLLAALLDEIDGPTLTPHVAVLGQNPASNVEKSNPCEVSDDPAERPPSLLPGHELLDREWIPFQFYGGRIRGRSVVGLFQDRLGDRFYEWSAEFPGRNRHMLDFRCRFNGHHGHASVLVSRRRFFGILRMGNRADRIEGERQGNIVRFTRLLAADSDLVADLPLIEISPLDDHGFEAAAFTELLELIN